MVLTEAEVWGLVRPLPADATIFLLPPAKEGTVNGADVARAVAVANRGPNEPRLSNERRRFSASVATVVASTEMVGRGKLLGTG